MATVKFKNVNKIFPGGVTALKDLTLAANDGEFLVLVGPSGCGKSTALRLVAGLESVSSGDILINGNRVNAVPPQSRDVAMVFQNYALYPHKTVRKNLEFPLRMMKVPKQERQTRLLRAARQLGLEDKLDSKPKTLSGGQRQRVAMGRAIVRDPAVFLMDEPLSNLDAKLRVEIRAEIAALQRRIGITTIYVTHDQVEAMTLGDRVAVLSDGALQQVGASQDLYENPANTFVASFIGSPRMNIFATELKQEDNGRFTVRFGNLELPVPANRFHNPSRLRKYEGKPVLAGLRPEGFVPPDNVPQKYQFQAVLRTTEELGHEQILYFESPEKLVFDKQQAQEPREEYETADTETTMVARFPAGPDLEPGATLKLGVDANGLYLFSQEGQALT